DVLALLGRVLPSAGPASEEGGLVLLHLLDDSRVRDGNGALVDPRLVAVRVVAVVMSVEREADRLARQGPDLRDDLARARWEVRVDDEHVVLEDDPAVVAVPLALDVTLVEVDVGSQRPDFADLGPGQHDGARRRP